MVNFDLHCSFVTCNEETTSTFYSSDRDWTDRDR